MLRKLVSALLLILAGLPPAVVGIENELNAGDQWIYRMTESIWHTALMEEFDGMSRFSVLASATRNDTLVYAVETVDSGLFRGEGEAKARDTIITRRDTVGWHAGRYYWMSQPVSLLRRPAVFLDSAPSFRLLQCRTVYSGDSLRMEMSMGINGSTRYLPHWGVISQDFGFGLGSGRNSESRSLELVSFNGRRFDWNALTVLDTANATGLRRGVAVRRGPGKSSRAWHTVDGRVAPDTRRNPSLAPDPFRLRF